MKMRYKKPLLIILGILAAGIAVGLLPPVRERLEWRLDALRVRLHYMINPPEEEAFIPNTPLPVELKPTATHATSPTPDPAGALTGTPQPTAAPTSTPTPLPDSAVLDEVILSCKPSTQRSEPKFYVPARRRPYMAAGLRSPGRGALAANFVAGFVVSQ